MPALTVELLTDNPSFIDYCLRSSEDATQYWENWQRTHPEDIPVIEEAKGLVKAAGWLLAAEQLKPAAIARMDEYLLEAPAKPRKVRWLPATIAAAAAVALLLIAVKWPFNTGHQLKVSSAVASLKLHYTAAGKTRQGYLLPDSSYVLLEKGAVLDIDSNYSSTNRDIHLTGTAYFKVAANQHMPFNVQGAGYIVTALGTSFRVTAADKQFHVLLEEGKVKVEKHNGTQRTLVAYLLPSQSLLVNTASPVMPAPQKFSQSNLAAWKAQEIIFDHTPFQDVVLQLEACYNINIKVEGIDMKRETFSGRFKNDALKDVLDVLSSAVDKQYQFTDSTNVLIK